MILTIARSDDPSVDIERLGQLHRILPQDGPNEYELVLTVGSKAVRITNPLARTQYSPELEAQLVELLGRDGVRLRPPPEV